MPPTIRVKLESVPFTAMAGSAVFVEGCKVSLVQFGPGLSAATRNAVAGIMLQFNLTLLPDAFSGSAEAVSTQAIATLNGLLTLSEGSARPKVVITSLDATPTPPALSDVPSEQRNARTVRIDLDTASFEVPPELGFLTKPNGEDSVTWFQRTRNLSKVDGNAGDETRRALIGEYMALDATTLGPGSSGCGEFSLWTPRATTSTGQLG